MKTEELYGLVNALFESAVPAWNTKCTLSADGKEFVVMEMTACVSLIARATLCQIENERIWISQPIGGGSWWLEEIH